MKQIVGKLSILLTCAYTCLSSYDYPIQFVSNHPQLTDEEETSHLNQYLQLYKQYSKIFGPTGSWKKGEIEVILNPEQIKKIQRQTKLRLMSNGIEEKNAQYWSQVGIIAEDNYWLWIRDAVIFPSGVFGTYDRIVVKHSLEGPPGAAILPMLSNKKIVVNVNYRHATRSWEIELPRGNRKKQESLEQAARRELKEETGCILDKLIPLGNMAPETGVMTSVMPVYLGLVSYSEDPDKEFSEAIVETPAFTLQELKNGFAKGFIEIPIRGKTVKVSCRDPFLAFAILQGEVKGHFEEKDKAAENNK